MNVTAKTTTATLDAERTDLLAQLAEARASLTGALDGLAEEQLGLRPTASALCLGGLVKHVTGVEAAWTRFVEGGAAAMGFDLPDGVTWQDVFTGSAREFPQWMIEHQAAFDMRPGDTLDGILERYRDAAARTDMTIASVPDLSLTQSLPEVPWHAPGETRSVRRVLLRLIQEIAQHAGHAEIIREAIDGRTAG